ncbi:MAG: cysteine hydrolase [Desulfobulbaceae bacterium]|nr:cysteine hydrolase [Desulfobulbaceae bacterium]
MKIKKQTSGLLLFFTVLIVSSFVFLARAPYTEGEPIQKGLPAKYAIIIIDLQEDFILPAGKLPVEQSQARKIVPSINSLLSSINANAVEVVYVGNEFSPADFIGNWFRNSAAIAGQQGTKLVSSLFVINDTYFSKEKPDAFSNTEFDQYLRGKSVNHLIVTGVFADQCVMATINPHIS